MSDVDERALEFLRRSPGLALLGEEPLDRREFADRLDISRSTAYRATTSLLERGAVTTDGNEYRTTAYGEALARAASRYRDGLQGADRLRPLFEFLDHRDLLENVHHFANVDVTVAKPENPYVVADRIGDLFDAGEDLRWTVTGRVFPNTVERFESGGFEASNLELIFDGSTLEWFRETIDSPVSDGFGVGDRHSVLVGAPPFTVGIVDDRRVAIVGFDDRLGLPAAIAETDAHDAIEWAGDVLDQCHRGAQSVARSTGEDVEVRYASH